MKKINLILSMMICLTISTLKVNASGGRLRINSIKTCNGVVYGQHSGDNHWHIAEMKDNIYYASGDAIYNNPCSTSSAFANTSNNQTNNNNKSQNVFNNTTTSTATNKTTKSTTTNTNKITITKKNNTNNNNSVKTNNANLKKETIIVKSDDNTLKTIIINGTSVEIKDIINYSTIENNIDIKVETNDEKASYEIKNSNLLKDGINEIIIEVKAESGKIKIYQIIVNKETIKSSNVGINIIINDEKIKFNDFKSKIYVSSSTNKIDINYTLEDSKAKVVMNNIDKVKVGSNILQIKVTSEDGKVQEYEIDIYKYSLIEEIIYGILGFAMLGGIGYGGYKILKRVKNNK